jgi:hypothetical protein
MRKHTGTDFREFATVASGRRRRLCASGGEDYAEAYQGTDFREIVAVAVTAGTWRARARERASDRASEPARE